MVIGFTGTRNGMTERQKKACYSIIKNATELHHGDCVGADYMAHGFAAVNGVHVHIHPPRDKKYRAFSDRNSTYVTTVYIAMPKDYLDRNKDIVDACDILVAAPETLAEELRSGTWSTVRYARKLKKPVIILDP